MLLVEKQDKQKQALSKGRTLSECISFLDEIAPIRYNQEAITAIKKLNLALGSVDTKIDTILVGGSNNKNLTLHFTSKILTEEGLRVGTIYASQILSYHERIFIDNEPVSNKLLTECLNLVIDTALKNNIEITAFEAIIAAGYLAFKFENVSVAIVEVGLGGRLDATAGLHAKICAITKITQKNTSILGDDLDAVAYETMGNAKPDCWFVSSEQSKLRLQKMKTFAEQNKLQWSMPTRKLAPLPYIYEQLFGKEAALAERISLIYVENIKKMFSPFLRGNLLETQKGQRGRPSLETKRNSLTNPLKTIKTFWNDNFSLRRAAFEILDKENPTILLDEASDEEAIENLFLGIRLLHYKNPIEELCIIMGLEETVSADNVLKKIRYLFKKIPGEIYFVPLQHSPCHSVDMLYSTARLIGIRATPFKSIKEAFSLAKKTILDRNNGVICFTGNIEIISGYWKQVRDIKKLYN